MHIANNAGPYSWPDHTDVAGHQVWQPVSRSWEVRDLDRALEAQLFQEPNAAFVEQLLLEELEMQRKGKESGISYDTLDSHSDERIRSMLSAPFADILGVPFPSGGRYSGKLGKALLAVRLTWDAISEHKPFDYYTGEGSLAGLDVELVLMYHFALKKLENCHVGKYTHVSQPSLHEATIAQAHESWHKAMAPHLKFRRYDARSSNLIQEGGARHFQVMVNDSLAQATADERYRHAKRELVLVDVAPLYFDMCRRFSRSPVMDQGEFIREAKTFVSEAERKTFIRDMFFADDGYQRGPNDYAKGYALFKVAEQKYSPKEIHRSILKNDPSPLLG